MREEATRRPIEAVWRMESARLIGGLVRMVRDLGLAEEALVTALERWPETGIPDRPARITQIMDLLGLALATP
jgi:predicted RNA polymerase sigma factor